MNCTPDLRWLGAVPAGRLRAQVNALSSEDWDADSHRQDTFAVHHQTRSIRLVWTSLERWPDVEAREQPSWERFAANTLPILQATGRLLGTPVSLMNAMLARLDPGGTIEPHVDAAPFFGRCYRLHVPLVTNPRVAFRVGDGEFHLKAGELYEVNNRKTHGVANGGEVPRVHLIFDLAPQ